MLKTSNPNSGLIKSLKENWQEEMQGAPTYRTMAEHEPDPERQRTLKEMADSETQHAQRWADVE